MKRCLVLGGYGHFGARIVRALANHDQLELWISGRNREHADALAASIERARARIRTVALDISDHTTLTNWLLDHAPGVLIHTAGPFQARDYSVAEACIAAGWHYIDLADGRRFVCDFPALDRRARDASVIAVSGASSLPGLSSAVIAELRQGLRAIDGVEISIVPGGKTPRGRATIAAVLSYCGKPVRMLENGQWSDHFGWQDTRRVRYPLFTRRVAVCDVPDLELFPERYSATDTVSFRAGLEFAVEHWFLHGMAWLTRAGLISDWSRYAGLFERLSGLSQLIGGDTGGMRVLVRGRSDDGSTITRYWDLIARSNHGPEIPCLPAIALTRKLLGGECTAIGAMPCIELISLNDFAAAATNFEISWSFHEGEPP